MSEVVYEVVICRNNGEKPFYIKVKDSGEFSDTEFDNNEFNFSHDESITAGCNMMLEDKCVLVLQRLDNVPKYIESNITDKFTYNLSDIKVFNSCSECNKKGMSLTLNDGTIIYPENTEDFEGFENSFVKINYNGEIVCAKVETYKYNSKEHSGAVELIEGCFRNYNKCIQENSENDCIESGRNVKPDILTKKLSKC